MSLPESGARALLGALRDHLAVAEKEGEGKYIVIRLDEGTASLGENDPATVANALTKILGRPEIARHLANTELTDGLLVD